MTIEDDTMCTACDEALVLKRLIVQLAKSYTRQACQIVEEEGGKAEADGVCKYSEVYCSRSVCDSCLFFPRGRSPSDKIKVPRPIRLRGASSRTKIRIAEG